MISKSKDFADPKSILDDAYAKPPNITVARLQLLTRRQQPGKSVSAYMRELLNLSHKCNFQYMKADDARLEYVRDAFVAGLSEPAIRQR